MSEDDNLISGDNKTDGSVFQLSRWTWFFIIALTAVLTVLYINNVFIVNKLMRDCSELEIKLESLQNNSVILQNQVKKLEQAERICNIAETKLGLSKYEKTPVIIK